MFFHIFKNSFIINDKVPGEIKFNYTVDKSLYNIEDPEEILEKIYQVALYQNNKSEYSDKTYFYVLSDSALNGTIQIYCNHMGLDYESYKIMVDHSNLYINSVVKIYEADYKDNYRLIEKRKWSYGGQFIPWDIGVLPFEYFINHIKYDEYANNIYTTMMNQYKEDGIFFNNLANSSDKILKFKDIEEFIDCDAINMAFNTEFDSFFFNKRLMKYLREKKYRLPDMNYEEEEKEEIKEEKKENDNKPIYKNLFDRRLFS